MLLADLSNQNRVFFFQFFVGGPNMTLLETKVPESIEDYQREKHRRIFENPELVQIESDFHKIVLEWDPYSELRFLRK